MDLTELIAWIGWATTAIVWAYRSWSWAHRGRLAVDVTATRHRLDTWTAALHTRDGAVVRIQHGRGRVPPLLTHRAITYAYRAVDPREPSLHHFDA